MFNLNSNGVVLHNIKPALPTSHVGWVTNCANRNKGVCLTGAM